MNSILSGMELGRVGPVDIVTNLLLALVLSLCNSFVYRKTHSGYGYSVSFNVTMISVAMIVTMIMMVIGNYLALSLGLVGALSVIRFRTAIKDAKDITYLFLSIAVGLACSTGDYVIAVLGTLIINITFYVLHLIRYGASTSSDYCLTFCLQGEETTPDEIAVKTREKFSKVIFRSYSSLSDNVGEYVYSVKLGNTSEEDAISFLKKELRGLASISLIAPETNLEV